MTVRGATCKSGLCDKYSKTCLKRKEKKAKNCFLRPSIAQCRSKVLPNSAILSTYVKLPFAI